MITFTVLVKDGGRSTIESLEVEELDAAELAQATELAHEALAHLERIARLQAARRGAKVRDA